MKRLLSGPTAAAAAVAVAVAVTGAIAACGGKERDPGQGSQGSAGSAAPPPPPARVAPADAAYVVLRDEGGLVAIEGGADSWVFYFPPGCCGGLAKGATFDMGNIEFGTSSK